MLKKNLTSFIGLFISYTLLAAPGDTTKVLVHDHVHWTWNGDKIEKTQFPDGSKTYAKILLKYTLSCPSSGCSDWDYTTQIKLREKINDSTYNRYGLARVITPYGGWLGNNFSHTWYFDVTDFAPLLQDSVEINARYGGWEDGFVVTTEFMFIEGTPPREVLAINPLAHGSFKYGDAADPNSVENQTEPQPINVLSNAKTFKVRTTASGHGFNGSGSDPGNPDNCAEFCNKWFKVNIDGTDYHQTQIWRDDCGVNPLHNQNGTWIYNRAGWCPGDRATTHHLDVTGSISPGTTQQVGFSWEPYSNTSPNNSSYIFDAQLIQYGDYNFQNEVELVGIGVPSMDDNYGRQNPACNNPEIKIANNGGATLTSLEIEYGILELGNTITYNWSGSLATGESTEIEIPTNGWLLQNTSSDVFFVKLKKPNDVPDESPWNNYTEAGFTRPEQVTNGVIIRLQTNSAASENAYTIKDDLGNTVVQKTSLNNNQYYRDTVSLGDGCYRLEITDSGCDGLYFFANNDGAGSLSVSDYGSSKQLVSQVANFGCSYTLAFTVGNGYSGEIPEFTFVRDEAQPLIRYFSVFPNPAQDRITVEVNHSKENTASQLTLFDMLGTLVTSAKVQGTRSKTNLDVSDLSPGIYLLRFRAQDGRTQFKKVIVE